jgi:hypothetical protein
MIIQELIERECCDEVKDLEPPAHRRGLRWWERVYVCKHCGQKWKWESYMDGAGGRSKRLVKVK